MKTISLLLLSGFFLSLLGFADSTTGGMSVLVEGNGSQEGTVYMSVCSSSDDYTQDEAGRHYSFPMKDGKATFKLNDLVPDSYALKLFVDLNGNGVIDMNFFGIPKEPYAFSNNAMGAFGPPDFSDASFLVRTGEVAFQTIKLRGE